MSGKTTVLVNLLMHEEGWGGGLFDRVHIVSPTIHQDSKWGLISTSGVRSASWTPQVQKEVEHFLEEDEEVSESGRPLEQLIIFDDFIGQGVEEYVSRMATRYRWSHINFVMSGQKLTALPPVVRNNTSHFFIWRSDGLELDRMSDELRGLNTRELFREMCRRAWTSNGGYGFLVVDRRPSMPRLMYRANFGEVLTPVVPMLREE